MDNLFKKEVKEIKHILNTINEDIRRAILNSKNGRKRNTKRSN